MEQNFTFNFGNKDTVTTIDTTEEIVKFKHEDTVYKIEKKLFDKNFTEEKIA